MTVHNAHAYCDESGNTGANLLDPRQPLLLVGGWLVNDGIVEVAERVVREYISILKPRDNELHGVQLLKSEIGTFSILNLMHDFYKLYCPPICQILEKRFLLAGTVHEVFMDPDSNPYVSDEFVFMWEGKHELVEKVYSLPDEILAGFAEAFNTLDRSLLLDSLRNIATALTSQSDGELADFMLGSLPNIDKIIEKHNIGRTRFDTITLNTPNVASFHMFFHSLEHVGRMAEIPEITLVHDESQQFEAVFRMVFEEFRDDERPGVIQMGPWSNVYYGFESLKGLRFADSKDEPLLQAADVFISAMYRYAVNVYRGKPNPATLTEIASLYLREPPPYIAMIRLITANWFADKLKEFK